MLLTLFFIIIIIIIIIMAANKSQRCCVCNGPNAICRNCSCVKREAKCFSCRPSVKGTCLNIVRKDLTTATQLGSPPRAGASLGSQPNLQSPTLLDSPHPDSAPSLTRVDSAVVSSATQVGSDSNSSRFDSLMLKAFGATLCPKIVPDDSLDDWVKRWQVISHLKGRLYHVPGGSIGHKYVDLLTVETSHLAVGNYPSE